jgi:hypothetical protein
METLAKETLAQIIDRLNSDHDPTLRESLRNIVKEWNDSGPNLCKMFKANPEIERRVCNSFRISVIPSVSGGAHVQILSVDCVRAMDSRDPYFIFAALTLSPYLDLFAGPCKRCDSYYIKKRKNQGSYCSRKCANAATAIVTSQKKRDIDHKIKLLKASEALTVWERTKSPRSNDWKEYVSQSANLTSKWITRAVNKGELLVSAH